MILNGLFLRIKLFHVFKLISSLLIQLSSILLIFKLAPQDLGVYTLILSISQLLFTIISAWNGGGILFFGTKFFKLKGSYSIIVFYRFIIIISCAILVFLLVYFTKDTLSKFLLNSTNLKLALYLFFGLFFYDFSSQLLYPSNRDRIQSVIELIYSIILLTSTYYLVKNITDYVTYFCFISGAFSIVIVIILLKYMPLNITEIKKVDFKKYVNYSKWQSLSVISIYIVNLGMNYIFVMSELSLKEIGQYNFAYRLFMGFSPLFAIFIIQTPKWIHSSNIKNKKNYITKKIYQFIFLLMGLYIIAFLMLKPLLFLIQKSVYLNSIDIFLKLFPAFVLMTIGNLLNTVLMNTELYRKAQFGLVIQCILLISFSFIFVNKWGLNGAILSTTASLFGSAFFFIFLFKRMNEIH